MARRFTRAVRTAQVLGGIATAAVLAILFLPRLSGGGDAAPPAVEQPDLNVAVVPAVDSAGFFVALHEGLFAAHGLHVTFVPAISSETVINAQALSKPGNRIDISCGNYVSYIQAQENYDQGRRPSSASGAMVAANLHIFAEGSVMEPGAQGLYVMPGSRIRTLAALEGKTIGVNAPGNILYLLAASALADHGLSVPGAHFAYYPLPEMAAMLKARKITAAVLPEPFASQAQLSLGVNLLADLDQGATSAFPVQGCAVTRQWAAQHPATLAAFRAAFEQGQEIADTNRPAVERAMEALPAPLGLTKVQAAVMALDSYPVGTVDVTRLQRVADVMRQYLSFPPFSIRQLTEG
ncbi:MAG: ABC transporter substrate-binding protein [Streptosporangiaceae bacterium]|nr:ABC transporter substrate-binding protein [Streptosporangiaceae bacterium]MBV9853089.1 ABC transporter substrate-binding protein [Streptosporangiaceae bacterium]